MTFENEFHGKPLAITEDGLRQLLAMANREVDITSLMSKQGEPLRSAPRITKRGNSAVLNIIGPIFQRANFLTSFLECCVLEEAAIDFNSALDDPSVMSIILNINSPGGQVFGVNEFSSMIRAARGRKHITAYVSGIAASAAYWICSAAEEVVLDASAMVGSIGCVFSVPRRGNDGVVEIVSTQSPKKRVNAESDEGRAQLLAQADAIANVFVSAVAIGRNVPPARVLSDFGQGGMLVGLAAVKSGMCDKLGSLEAILAANQYRVSPQNENKDVQKGTTKMKTNMDFMALVRERQAETAMSLADAMKEIVAEQPELHRAYIASANQGHREATSILSAESMPAGKHRFLELVDDYRAKNGGTLTSAMQEVVRQNPQLHRDYLLKANEER